MIRALLAGVAIVAACGGEAARQSQPAQHASSPTPHIDVSDMMGGFPATTFYVVRPGHVVALALLNHATKYAIPVEGDDVQVAVADEAGRVYVLDRTGEGARLRWFDIASGAERRSHSIRGAALVSTGTGHGALAFDPTTGEVYALVRHGSTIALEEFEGFTLQPVRRRLQDMRCGDRVAASGGRVVVACLGEGLIVLDQDVGSGGKFSARGPLVSIAMAANGTVMAGSADGRLFRLAPGARDLETIDTLRERGTRLITDGIVAQADCCFVVGVLDRVTAAKITVLGAGLTLVAFPEATPPRGGMLVQGQFAYYTAGTQARHVDIQQGFAEVMASFAEDVLPGAVAGQ